MGLRGKRWEGKEATEWKVVKLERNGPKGGQSVRAWEAGKRRGDLEWESKRRKAIDHGQL